MPRGIAGSRPDRFCKACGHAFVHASYNRRSCSDRCRKELHRRHNATLTKTGRGKCGYYRGILCQSTYELAFVVWATDWGLPIKRSTLRIPYRFEGQDRIYHPDFEIGNIVYEIKGRIEPNVSAKIKAAARHVTIVVIDKKKIREYIEHVEAKYGKRLNAIYPILYEQRPAHTFRCTNCETDFSRVAGHKGNRPFCSRSCAGKFRAKNGALEGVQVVSDARRARAFPIGAIQAAYEEGNGISYSKIAKRFGCSKARVAQIVKLVLPTGVEPVKSGFERAVPFPPGDGREVLTS